MTNGLRTSFLALLLYGFAALGCKTVHQKESATLVASYASTFFTGRIEDGILECAKADVATYSNLARTQLTYAMQQIEKQDAGIDLQRDLMITVTKVEPVAHSNRVRVFYSATTTLAWPKEKASPDRLTL